MKMTNSQKIKTGIFTLIGIILFVLGIFVIGSKKNMFGDTFLIYGTFKNVGGLNVGNNIRFAGITVGTVEDIQIVSDTVIRVDMLMKGKVREFLKTDAVATIGSDGLMGDKLITITSGTSNQTALLREGSQIKTNNPVDFDKVIGTFTNVADNANIITTELAGMAVQIRKGNGTISKLLYTDDLSRSLEGTAYNAQRLTSSLADITAHVKSGKGSMGNLLYTDTLSTNLNKTAASANTALATINEAAYGFSENMKALQGNFFLRGYFKKKAKEKAKADTTAVIAVSDDIDPDMDEEELEELIAEAKKALDAKRKKD